jgi:hypothetical protein
VEVHGQRSSTKGRGAQPYRLVESAVSRCASAGGGPVIASDSEAIQFLAKNWIASSQELLAMTRSFFIQGGSPARHWDRRVSHCR